MTKNKLSSDADAEFKELCAQLGLFLINYSRVECVIGKYAASLSSGKFHPSDEELLNIHKLNFGKKLSIWKAAVKKHCSPSALEMTNEIIEKIKDLQKKRNQVAHALLIPQGEGWVAMHRIQKQQVVWGPLNIEDLVESNLRMQAIVDALASEDNPIIQRPPIKTRKL